MYADEHGEEIKERPEIGKEDDRPDPGERRDRRLVAQKNKGDQRPSEQVAEPDEGPVHGFSKQ